LSSAPASDLAALQRKTLDLYGGVTLLMLLGIGVLVAYAIRLGPLTSPGAERSFGFALCLMSLMSAVIFHLMDRTYRVWPLGRRFRPTPPAAVTPQHWIRLLKVLVVVLAVAAIAYLIAGAIA
jgi:hypothetical protein